MFPHGSAITTISSEEDLIDLEPEWQQLLAVSDGSTPFQTWEWIWSWWKHHGQGRMYLLVARREGALVGLLPLFISRFRGLPLRQIRFMGAPLSDLQNLISSREDRDSCGRAFFAHIAADAHLWDFCDLADLLEQSSLREQAQLAGLSLEQRFHRLCPSICLAPTWSSYTSSLGKKMRSKAGYYRRRLRRELGAVFDMVHGAEVPEAMTELFRLHNTRWKARGASGALSDSRTQKFHLEVARRFDEKGWLRLCRLRAQGRTVAMLYGFHFGRRSYNYLSGFDVELAKYSPGQALLSYSIEQAISETANEYDLLRGAESYKYDWNAVDRRTERLIVGRSGIRSRVGRRLHALEYYLEHRGLRLQRWLWDGAGARGRVSDRE